MFNKLACVSSSAYLGDHTPWMTGLGQGGWVGVGQWRGCGMAPTLSLCPFYYTALNRPLHLCPSNKSIPSCHHLRG